MRNYVTADRLLATNKSTSADGYSLLLSQLQLSVNSRYISIDQSPVAITL